MVFVKVLLVFIAYSYRQVKAVDLTKAGLVATYPALHSDSCSCSLVENPGAGVEINLIQLGTRTN